MVNVIVLMLFTMRKSKYVKIYKLHTSVFNVGRAALLKVYVVDRNLQSFEVANEKNTRLSSHHRMDNEQAP